MTHGSQVFKALLRKLDRLAPLSQEDHAMIERWPALTARMQRGRDLLEATGCRVLVDGFAARVHSAEGGEGQITCLYFPGDFLDSPCGQDEDGDILAISDGSYLTIPKALISETMRARPGIAQAIWSAVLTEAATTRRWLLSIGHRNAKSRTAHLLCEIRYRLAGCGDPCPDSFAFPLTQEQLGMALGLTSVHVNRVLRDLRELGCIHVSKRIITICDPDELRRIGKFDPSYLGVSRKRSSVH